MLGQQLKDQVKNIDQEDLKRRTEEHLRLRVLPIDEVDRQIWELITQVPRGTKVVASVCAIINFFLPGFGTFILACTADNVSKSQLTIGCTQSLLSFFLIGWVWAQYWSYLFVKLAFDDQLDNLNATINSAKTQATIKAVARTQLGNLK